jgi:hypothetical protein
MLTPPSGTPEFTLAEISGAVSRVTGLPTEHAEVARYSGNLLGLMNSNPALRMAGANSPAIADYIRQYIPAELAEKADPARRAELDNRESSNATAAAAATATTAWLARMQGGRDWAGNGYGGGDGKANAAGTAAGSRMTSYQDIAYNSPQSLQMVSSGSYLSTPFAKTGMDFGTFNYLRSYDKSFTGQNILHAAQDAKALGFSPNDKEAVKDHAAIDHYSNDARGVNTALQGYQHLLRGDSELLGWANKIKEEKDPAKRAALQAQIDGRLAEHRRNSKIQHHIDTDTPKASKAEKSRVRAIERKLNINSIELQQKKGNDYSREGGPDQVGKNRSQHISDAEFDKKLGKEKDGDRANLESQLAALSQPSSEPEPAKQAPAQDAYKKAKVKKHEEGKKTSDATKDKPLEKRTRMADKKPSGPAPA